MKTLIFIQLLLTVFANAINANADVCTDSSYLENAIRQSKKCTHQLDENNLKKCTFKVLGTSIELKYFNEINEKEISSGLGGSGYYINSVDPNMDVRLLHSKEGAFIKINMKKHCNIYGAILAADGKVYHESLLNSEVVLTNGAAISVCVNGRKKCRLSDDERNSDWGYFSDITVCKARIKDWKLYGVNTGDPQCVPCKRILRHKILNTLSCDNN